MAIVVATPALAEQDIRELSQHFIDSSGDISPWMFIPEDNIESCSAKTNPGYVKFSEAGKGKDVKGILKDPIRIDDYPLPWEFELGILQDMIIQVGQEGQTNYAVGLNIAVTFSDPSTWPEDRTQMPPDTHSVQLFVVHLGNLGENYRPGIPALRKSELNWNDPTAEVYLLYGRGDLAENVLGDWRMAYSWQGGENNIAGAGKLGGPADFVIRFRARLASPTSLEIGMGYGMVRGYNTRHIDTSKFGKITGIWEIGPIVSADRWIPDTLAAELGLDKPPTWMQSLRARYSTKWSEHPPSSLEPIEDLFKVEPPIPGIPYYVDYATFRGAGTENIEHFSDDFNIPTLFADQGAKYYIEANCYMAETFSNPGYLTMTALGNSSGWAICPAMPGNGIDLIHVRKPPFEIAVGFVPPPNSEPWNLWWNVGLGDEEHVAVLEEEPVALWQPSGNYYSWQPTIKNIPGVGCKYLNVWTTDPKKWEFPPDQDSKINPKFDSDIRLPDEGETLHWVLQVMDQYRVRVGYKTGEDEPWTFSSVFNSKDVFGKIGKFGYPALVSYQLGEEGMGVGNYPSYHRFQLDYIHYRFTLSE